MNASTWFVLLLFLAVIFIAMTIGRGRRR